MKSIISLSCHSQGVSTNKGGDVEIIRYQVLIPVTDVQVRTIAKEGEDHFLWELVHMRCHPQRRSERVYLLSNRSVRYTLASLVRRFFLQNRKFMVFFCQGDVSYP